MRERFGWPCFNAALVCAIGLVFLVSECPAWAQRRAAVPSPEEEISLKHFLQDYLKDPTVGIDQTTRYIAAFVHLSDDGNQEVVVYVTGRWWCGSGGCRTLVLSAAGSSFTVVSDILITRPPVRVLEKKSHGWRNIAVWVQGGGIRPGYEAELRFDGTSYPISPANPPALPLTGRTQGKVLVDSSQEGKPLYP